MIEGYAQSLRPHPFARTPSSAQAAWQNALLPDTWPVAKQLPLLVARMAPEALALSTRCQTCWQHQRVCMRTSLNVRSASSQQRRALYWLLVPKLGHVCGDATYKQATCNPLWHPGYDRIGFWERTRPRGRARRGTVSGLW